MPRPVLLKIIICGGLKYSSALREVSQAGSDVWLVVLLYKDGYAECRVLMKCLEELAVKYPETKFDEIVFIDCVLNYPDYNLPILLVYNNDPVLNSGHDGTDLSRDSVIEGVKRRLIEKVVKEHEDTIKSTFIFLPLFFCASVRESRKVMFLKPRSVYRKIVVEEAYNL
ncbi:hypothetical protein DKX38_026921 [Salix brachista]|uniref:Phosducin thioredoxin-like domain-containing protein n=1 Tax=Salix brachista TaxID=2182728 RepID=A0A5N5JFY8_9ROSI|nr:hypothetical protein DKX38_026921 [Salix brachista]